MRGVAFLARGQPLIQRPGVRWVGGAIMAVSILLPDRAVATAPQAGRGGQATLLARFAATGLPVGPATGVAWRKMFPAGFTSRHLHGGPGYIYVISGVVQLSDAAGSTTYRDGTFFWEPSGHIHIMRILRRATPFVLRFLPSGATDTTVAR